VDTLKAHLRSLFTSPDRRHDDAAKWKMLEEQKHILHPPRRGVTEDERRERRSQTQASTWQRHGGKYKANAKKRRDQNRELVQTLEQLSAVRAANAQQEISTTEGRVVARAIYQSYLKFSRHFGNVDRPDYAITAKTFPLFVTFFLPQSEWPPEPLTDPNARTPKDKYTDDRPILSLLPSASHMRKIQTKVHPQMANNLLPEKTGTVFNAAWGFWQDTLEPNRNLQEGEPTKVDVPLSEELANLTLKDMYQDIDSFKKRSMYHPTFFNMLAGWLVARREATIALAPHTIALWDIQLAHEGEEPATADDDQGAEAGTGTGDGADELLARVLQLNHALTPKKRKRAPSPSPSTSSDDDEGEP
jgi:hypothetical protein